jgi:Kyakuja-Dileera-Zisupton transposase
MDGNNSLKRVEGVGRADGRTFISDYLIPQPEIDCFKDDVRNRPGEHVPRMAEAPADVHVLSHGFEQTVCTDKWVAANAVSKDTLQLFEQTGVFVSVCRHGFVQTLVEMRRSGELFVISCSSRDRALTVSTVRSMASVPSTESLIPMVMTNAWVTTLLALTWPLLI